MPTEKKERVQIGDTTLMLIVEVDEGLPKDTKVFLENGELLCTISGEHRGEFLRELDELVDRYRI